MIRAYRPGVAGGCEMTLDGRCDGLAEAVWIDMDSPRPHETAAIEALAGIELPSRADMEEIEFTSRAYQEGPASVMTITTLVGVDSGDPAVAPVSFVLLPDRLITIRYHDPKSFRSMTDHCTRLPTPETPMAATLKLLDQIVDRTADILEKTSNEIDAVSRLAFGRDAPANQRMSSKDLQEILRRIGQAQFVVNKVHDSLITLNRMVGFLNLPPAGNGEETMAARRAKLDKRHREELKGAARDIGGLVESSNYLSNNIQFLLDAALGRISIEQNAIIKIFSVAAVVFLPPTLVGTVYGMNFEHMPELSWVFGYPIALLLMVLSAVLPYLWFKSKGWL